MDEGDARTVAMLDMEKHRQGLGFRRGYITGDDCLIDALLDDMDRMGELYDYDCED